MEANLKHADVTDRILHAFFKKVYHRLGYGFLEKVYENAMALELRHMGLKVEQQAAITVYYGSYAVGEYYADLLVEDAVIVELKALRRLTDEEEAPVAELPPGNAVRSGTTAQLRPESRIPSQGV